MTPNNTSGVGAKSLHKDLIKVTLPSYDKLKHQIQLFREAAKCHHEQIRQAEFNHTIAILGGRGTGKTSVLYTLIAGWQSDQPGDTLLDIIVPEKMSSVSDTLGWIIAGLKEKVDEIDPHYFQRLQKANRSTHKQDSHFDTCIKSAEETPLKKAYVTLAKHYHLRRQHYLQTVLQRNEGIASYIKDNEKIINADLELINSFHKLIDEWVKLHSHKESPLVFIFFDDVDISAERTGEVLETILHYLSWHPNIVSFVTGDYPIFSEAMTLHFLKKEGISTPAYLDQKLLAPYIQEDHQDNSVLGIRQERSEEFLKKILPPAYRYQMAELNEIERWDFRFAGGEQTLGKLIGNIRFKLTEAETVSFAEKWNELQPTRQTEMRAYAAILDSTPRGCANVYTFLQSKATAGDEWNGDDVKKFLRVLVASSHTLRKYEPLIHKVIEVYADDADVTQLRALNVKDSRVDYDVLLHEWKSKLQVEISPFEIVHEPKKQSLDREQKFQTIFPDIVRIGMLVTFFEQIFLLAGADHQRQGLKVIELLNEAHDKDYLFPDMNDGLLSISMYQTLEYRIGLRGMRKLFTSEAVTANEITYFQTVFSLRSEKELAEKLHTLYYLDQTWTENKINYLFTHAKSVSEIYQQAVQAVELPDLVVDKPIRIDLEWGTANPLSEAYSVEDVSAKLSDNVSKSVTEALSSGEGAESNQSRVDVTILAKIIEGLEERERLILRKQRLEMRLSSLKQQIERMRSELPDLDSERIKANTRSRREMVAQINQLEQYLERRESDWEIFEDGIEECDADEAKLLWSDDTFTFDPQHVVQSLPLDWGIISRRLRTFEPKQFVYTGFRELDDETNQFIQNYINAREEVALLKSLLPIDMGARFAELQATEKESVDRQDQWTDCRGRLQKLSASIRKQLAESNMFTGTKVAEEAKTISAVVKDSEEHSERSLEKEMGTLLIFYVSSKVESVRNQIRTQCQQIRSNYFSQESSSDFKVEDVRRLFDVYRSVIDGQRKEIDVFTEEVELNFQDRAQLEWLKRAELGEKAEHIIKLLEEDDDGMPLCLYAERLSRLNAVVESHFASNSVSVEEEGNITSIISQLEQKLPQKIGTSLVKQHMAIVSANDTIKSVINEYVELRLLIELLELRQNKPLSQLLAYKEQVVRYYRENRDFLDGFTNYLRTKIQAAYGDADV